MDSEHHWVQSLDLPSDRKTKLKRANPIKGLGNWKEKAGFKSIADTYGICLFPHLSGCGVGGRLLPSLRESRPLLSLLLCLKSPSQGEQGLKVGLYHFTAACMTAQSRAGGAGNCHLAMLLPRPPSFWRQKHAKPCPAGREHPRLSWGGTGMLSRCKTVCRGISVALLPPIQLGRQRVGGMPRIPLQTAKDQRVRWQVLCYQPLLLWCPGLSGAEATRGTQVLPSRLTLHRSR